MISLFPCLPEPIQNPLALTFSLSTVSSSGSLSSLVTVYSSLGYPGSTKVMRGSRGVGTGNKTETRGRRESEGWAGVAVVGGTWIGPDLDRTMRGSVFWVAEGIHLLYVAVTMFYRHMQTNVVAQKPLRD